MLYGVKLVCGIRIGLIEIYEPSLDLRFEGGFIEWTLGVETL